MKNNIPSLVKYILLVIFCQCCSALECGYYGIDITCTCLSNSITCDGSDDGTYDLVEAIYNISSHHFSPSASSLNGVFLSVNGLAISPNVTFAGMPIKELKLGFKLEKLNDDIFGSNMSLVRLDLQNNSFEHVPFKALQALNRLEYLDLSHNKIVSLTNKEFQGLPNLKILNLHHNKIYLLLDPFSPLQNLEIMNLDFNKLPQSQMKELKNLPNLKRLSVASNLIREFHPESIKDLRFLTKLNIAGNEISSLTRINISSTSLKEFSASGCSIQGVLSKTVLGNLPNLILLDLSFNNMTEIMPHALSNLKQLEVLNLSQNHIESIRDNAFASTHNIRDLDLSGNGLNVLQKEAFRNLTRLRTLKLDKNSLVGFICSYTVDMLELETLDLSHNQIQAISPGTFQLSRNLSVLKLDGNAFDCNSTCDTAYFSSYLQNNSLLSKSDIDEVVCKTPIVFRGKRMVDVPINALSCPVNVLNDTNPCRLHEEDDDDYEDDFEEEEMTSTSTEMTSTTATAVTTTETRTTTSKPTTTTTPTTSTTNTPTATTTATTTTTDALITTGTPTATTTDELTTNTTATIVTTTLTSATSTVEFSSTISPITSSTTLSTTDATIPDLPFSTDDQTDNITISDATKDTGDINHTTANNDKSTADTISHTPTTVESLSTTSLNLEFNTTSDSTTYPTTSEYRETTIDSSLNPPFNLTYFDLYYHNLSAVVIKWKVTMKENPTNCHIVMILEISKKKQGGKYECSDKSIVITKLEQDVPVTVCLTYNHVVYGFSTVCKQLYFPPKEAASSKSANAAGQSNLSFNILIGLLIIAICIALIVATHHMKKQCAANHYNVSEKESVVQKRNSKRQSNNSYRISYTQREPFDSV